MAISEFLAKAREQAGFATAAEEPEDEIADPDVLGPDPAPVRASSRGRRESRTPAAATTAKIRKQVKDSLTVMMGLPAGMISMRDPVCGGALGGQSEAIADALVPIICRNPGMLRWFTEGQGMMDWITLVTAVWPVARTVWDHHSGGGAGEGWTEDDGADWDERYAAPRMAA